MKNPDIEKYKEAWQMGSDKILENRKLTESEISEYMKGRSKDISRLFRTGLQFDIGLKAVLITACLYLPAGIGAESAAAAVSIGLLGVLSLLGILQVRNLVNFPAFEMGGKNLREIISTKISYYSKTYKKALYIGAASAPGFFLCGSLYYFQYKYGGIREFQIDDYIVFGAGIVLSYIISIVSQLMQFRFQMNQLQSCLQEIDDNTISDLTIKEQKNKRIRLLIAVVLAVIAGLLLFTYLLFR